jgi:hypothetical protein
MTPLDTGRSHRSALSDHCGAVRFSGGQEVRFWRGECDDVVTTSSYRGQGLRGTCLAEVEGNGVVWNEMGEVCPTVWAATHLFPS